MNDLDTKTESGLDPTIGLVGVTEHFDVSQTTIMNWVARGEFPKPARLGRRLLRWRVAEINSWIANGCPHFK